MKSIVWRTLVSFWGATAVILAVVVFSSDRVGQQGNENLYAMTSVELIETAREVFAADGINGVRDWVSDSQNFPPGITLYLLDNEGYDFLGRLVTPLFLWPRRTDLPTPGAERGGGGMGPGPARPTLVSADGVVYSMVIGPAPQPRLGAFGLPSVQWIVLLTALGASAIACFTGPLRRRLLRLQTAAESLAQGDLSARVNLKTNDEIGAVGQQFDRMAERLEKMIHARQELFRNVSHEIRSPLARIQVALVLAEEERGESDENLDRIRHETEEIDSLMQQILGLAKLDDPDRERELEDLDLVEVVSLVVDDARFETKTQNKELSWNPPATSLKVRGLSDMLSSAVENVLRNAITHTPDDTRVDVTLTEYAGAAELRIEDHGNGVSDSDLEEIFEPFYRGGNKRTGAGIGLAITRTAVALMKGTVEAAAVPGGGLQVKMRLPLAQ
jgi:signal transduction histidine kinase